MFDVDELVAACQVAIGETEPLLAVRDVLERTVADQGAIAEALPPERGELAVAGAQCVHSVDPAGNGKRP